MTSEEIQLVQASFDRVAPKARVLVETFYEEVFQTAPHLRHLFPADMTEQRKKLLQTLTYAVNGLKYPHSIIPVVKALGLQHRDYNVDPDQYRLIGTALIKALDISLGSSFTPAERAAWISCYQLLAQVMQDGAQAA